MVIPNTTHPVSVTPRTIQRPGSVVRIFPRAPFLYAIPIRRSTNPGSQAAPRTADADPLGITGIGLVFYDSSGEPSEELIREVETIRAFDLALMRNQQVAPLGGGLFLNDVVVDYVSSTVGARNNVYDLQYFFAQAAGGAAFSPPSIVYDSTRVDNQRNRLALNWDHSVRVATNVNLGPPVEIKGTLAVESVEITPSVDPTSEFVAQDDLTVPANSVSLRIREQGVPGFEDVAGELAINIPSDQMDGTWQLAGLNYDLQEAQRTGPNKYNVVLRREFPYG